MLPTRIVAIGASTFFGRVDPEGGGFIGRLKTWHESNGRKNCVFNLGISSETTADILKRLTSECTPRRPDLIILNACSNDARRRGSSTSPNEVPLEEFKTNMRELLKQAQSFCPVMIITGHAVDEKRTNPVKGTDKHFSLADLRLYFDAAREICSEEKVPFLDIFNDWINQDYLPWLWEDGLHPNAEGHRRIFETLKNFLTKNSAEA